MSNERLAMLFFDAGLVLAMIAMVLGPFGITNWALTCGVVACFFAVASLCLGFLSWEDEEEPADPAPPEEKPQDPVSK